MATMTNIFYSVGVQENQTCCLLHACRIRIKVNLSMKCQLLCTTFWVCPFMLFPNSMWSSLTFLSRPVHHRRYISECCYHTMHIWQSHTHSFHSTPALHVGCCFFALYTHLKSSVFSWRILDVLHPVNRQGSQDERKYIPSTYEHSDSLFNTLHRWGWKTLRENEMQ